MIVAVFDLDGTLLSHNSSFSFCRWLRRQGVFSRADLLYCSSLYATHLLFGLSLLSLHTRVFNRLFRGRSAERFQPYVQPFIQTLSWYEPGLRRLEELREQGAEVHIFSNSPRFLVELIAASIGVKNVSATDYKIDNAGLMWNIATLVDGKKKGEMLQAFKNETIAFSDSHHDFPFLQAASRAVAVNPNRRLSKIAAQQKWEVL
ncbi:MAG: hypothetical protein S4CHLAM2_10770 [Chlamydiales bacterium]|nr:hypothetical protein [Chlamydiales bacterium]